MEEFLWTCPLWAGAVHAAFKNWAKWYRKLLSITNTSLGYWIRYSIACAPGKARQDFCLGWEMMLCKVLKMKLLAPSIKLWDALFSFPVLPFLDAEFIYYFDVLHWAAKCVCVFSFVFWFLCVCLCFVYLKKKSVGECVLAPWPALLTFREVGITCQAVSIRPMSPSSGAIPN